MGILLGNNVGRLENYDHENNCRNWCKFMMLQVTMLVRESFEKSFEFILSGGVAVTVNFHHEKLCKFSRCVV